MNAIEMYDVLKNIPNVSDEQARTAADTIVKGDVKDLATKADLANLEARLVKWGASILLVNVLALLSLILKIWGG